jgi:hypothetical protein
MVEALNNLTPQEYESYITLDYEKVVTDPQTDKAKEATRLAFLKEANKLSTKRYGRSFAGLHGKPLSEVFEELKDHDAMALLQGRLPEPKETVSGAKNGRIVTDQWGRNFWRRDSFISLFAEPDDAYFAADYFGNPVAPYYYPMYQGKASLPNTGIIGINHQEVYVFEAASGSNIPKNPQEIYVQSALSAYFAIANSPETLDEFYRGTKQIPYSITPYGAGDATYSKVQVVVGVDEYNKFLLEVPYVVDESLFARLFRIVAY